MKYYFHADENLESFLKIYFFIINLKEIFLQIFQYIKKIMKNIFHIIKTKNLFFNRKNKYFYQERPRKSIDYCIIYIYFILFNQRKNNNL